MKNNNNLCQNTHLTDLEKKGKKFFGKKVSQIDLKNEGKKVIEEFPY